MPDFRAEIDIDPWDYVQECSRADIKELIEALKEEVGGGGTVVNTLWGAAGVTAICAGAGVDVGASVAGVGFLKRRIL